MIRRGFTLIEFLVVIAIFAILMALLLPAVQKVREAANKMRCLNNLKQMALGMHNHNGAYGKIPVAAWLRNSRLGTWQVPLLQFIEQEKLFSLYGGWGGPDNGQPWSNFSSPANARVTTKRIMTYTCPSETEWTTRRDGGFDITKHNYSVNMGNTGILNPQAIPYNGVAFKGAPFALDKAFSLSEISREDGTSATLMIGEVVQGKGSDARGFGWQRDPALFSCYQGPNSDIPDLLADIDEEVGDQKSGSCLYPYADNPPCKASELALDPERPVAVDWRYGSRSRHPGGVQVAFCDGSAKFIADDINIEVWRGLSTTKGREIISEDY
jgi:prepilin-type N-terminal cleavage/methylation domain-containing protein/prepilin-type processing-associated H-X9-DG protein